MGIRNRKGARGIRQLLSHTSGIGDYFGPKFDEKKLGIREVKDYLPLLAEESRSNTSMPAAVVIGAASARGGNRSRPPHTAAAVGRA